LKRIKRERIEAGALWEKEKEAGGFWPKGHLLPPLMVQNRERRRIGRRPAWREGASAALATAAAGKWGYAERGTRGSHPRAHLGLGRTVEAAPREGSGAVAVLGGDGAVKLGEEGRSCCETAMVRCGDLGSCRPLL
jgi:hypothetical protein